MKEIGLLDVDGHDWPNLPLMKLSAWHKSKGDAVEPWFGPLRRYDIVYRSKVFTFTPDVSEISAQQSFYGGTGFGLNNGLPNDIEHIYPDYDLYGIKNTAYGFLTRGCARQCPFCVVSEKEGTTSVKVADLAEFWRGQQKIKILDANILQCKDAPELLNQLAESKADVDFTQGLDARLLNADLMDALKRVKTKRLRFAWDNPKLDMEPAFTAIKNFFGYPYARLCVYVLTNFNSTFDEDLHRVETLKRLGFDPYVMVYDKRNAPRKSRLLQGYVNNRRIFRSCEWKDYAV